MLKIIILGLVILQLINCTGCKNETSPSWLAQETAGHYLFAACDNETGKYGYINSLGEWKIPPEFDETSLLIPYLMIPQMDLLPAKLGDEWGYINKNGDWKIEPTYKYAAFFEQDIAGVHGGNQHFGYIDRNGNLIKNPNLLETPFACGLAMKRFYNASGELYYGYINRQEEWIICPQFEFPPYQSDARPYKLSFSEGYAVAYDGKNYGMIDLKGNYHILPKYEDLLPFTEGVAAARIDGLWGFINHNGKWVITPRFEDAKIFTEGFAAIRINGRWGFIDHSGNIAIPADYGLEYEEYIYFLGFHEQLAVVWDINEGVDKDPLLGYIGQTGEWEISPRFERAEPFCNGVAFVKELESKNAMTVGYINKKGDYLIKWTE